METSRDPVPASALGSANVSECSKSRRNLVVVATVATTLITIFVLADILRSWALVVGMAIGTIAGRELCRRHCPQLTPRIWWAPIGAVVGLFALFFVGMGLFLGAFFGASSQ